MRTENDELQRINKKYVYALFVFIVLLLATTPASYLDGSDKGRYLLQFDTIEKKELTLDIKDKGWIYFVRAFHAITFGNSYLYFIATAFIYAFSFYYFAKKNFEDEYIGYFLLMTVGLLGFGSFANNIIRNGIALALCIYAISIERKWLSIVLVAIAYTIHGSVLILVGSYVYSLFVKNTKYAMIIWLICLYLCVFDMDVSGLFARFNMVDQRVQAYSTEAVDWVRSTYANYGKFRLDFLLYSVIPIYIADRWLRKYEYSNEFYSRIVNMYLLSNALWLLLMRQAYADRFAILSWIMIPLVTLYPILDGGYEYVPQENNKVFSIILTFLGINALLSLRIFF